MAVLPAISSADDFLQLWRAPSKKVVPDKPVDMSLQPVVGDGMYSSIMKRFTRVEDAHESRCTLQYREGLRLPLQGGRGPVHCSGGQVRPTLPVPCAEFDVHPDPPGVRGRIADPDRGEKRRSGRP